jgi:uncharacterized lipoprotein YddW (UPF0748 family)
MALAVASTFISLIAHAAEPFIGAYTEFPMLFNEKDSPQEREHSMAEQLNRFQDAGLRVVIPLVVTGQNVAFYPTKLIPSRAYQDWDPLAILKRLAHERGLKVYPWIATMNSGNQRPKGILKEHPDWALRDEDSQPIGFISPGHPEGRKHVIAMIKEVVTNYKPDGVLLDYLRFHDDETALDAVSQESFDRLHPEDRFPRKGKEFRQASYAFKRQLLTELVGQISGEVRAIAPKMPIAIYMWHAGERKYTRDWATWVERGYIDHINLRGYYYRKNEGEHYLEKLEQHFHTFTEAISELHRPVELTMCIGIDTSYDKIRSAREIEEYLNVAGRCGLRGATFFTWAPMLPFLSDIKKAGYVEKFAADLSTK